MKDIEISRDKKNPTWAYVWDYKDKSDIRKTIILDIFEPVHGRINTGTCLAVHGNDIENYINGLSYCLIYFNYYEIIKEPEYRHFETIEEYIEATKDRKDFRIIKKDGKILYNGINLHYWITGELTINGNIDSEEFFNNYVWFDDRSPVGVKCS